MRNRQDSLEAIRFNNEQTGRLFMFLRAAIAVVTITFSVSLAGCGGRNGTAPSVPVDCAVAVAPHSGEAPIDQEIARLQGEARNSAEPSGVLERLGWSFVRKARMSFDPGFYKLAESCAACIETRRPGDADALLLRGHALDSLHRFKEAEAIGRELVARRGLHVDFGLLGDALMEQGRLDEAVKAYQQMIDLKPGPQSYSRAAHIRWLKGDLHGAIELMSKVVRSASDDDFATWSYTRLALYELQAGDFANAKLACKAALALETDYAPAYLIQSRVLLAEGKAVEAVEPSRRAARLNPLPEYLWVLADALRAANRIDEFHEVETQLKRRGAADDPRTFAVYLATRGEQISEAVTLAVKEIETRQDVFTVDALAWSLAAAGRLTEARASMRQALAQGTKDARLFYHAGSIAAMSGERKEAHRWFAHAAAISQMLLPSEREQMDRRIAEL